MDKQAYDPKQLYETLVSVLNNVHLSEIAVSPYILPEEEEPTTSPQASSSTSTSKLPPLKKLIQHSIRPFSLIEGDKLVIPQKPLYAIYGYAVKALSQYPRDILRSTIIHPLGAEDGLEEHKHAMLNAIDDLTKCMLIQTPEHARAMNLRKRLLLMRLAHCKDASRKGDIIRTELHWTELILGISANAKMAPLWHHRKWLYSLKHSLITQDTQLDKKEQSLLDKHLKGRKLLRIDPVPLTEVEFEHELQLVEVCAERYPRNYQAWSYRYWLIKGQLSTSSTAPSNAKASGEAAISESRDNEENDAVVLRHEYERMEKHLSTNITDHTAATHALNIIELSTQLSKFEDTSSSSLLNTSWTFALDFVSRYPYKETPWLLLRGVLAILKVQLDADPESKSMQYQTCLREALSLAASLTSGRRAEGEQEASEKEEVNMNEREQKQMLSSMKYATRSLFYLSCSAEIAGHPSLGSDEAKDSLEQFS